METPNMNVKLLIDKKSRKVLFAEASKGVVDFLFAILSLPIGTVIRLLAKQGMVGCLGNLYKSVEDLNETYIQPKLLKDTLLKPKVAQSFCIAAPLLCLNETGQQTATKSFYRCSNSYGHNYVSDDKHARCPNCGCSMSTTVTYVASSTVSANEMSSKDGFVVGVVTYMITDDLVITPLSTISTIVMLNKFNVVEVNALEEKIVNLGMDEGVRLLKASLECNTVLTKTFLDKDGEN